MKHINKKSREKEAEKIEVKVPVLEAKVAISVKVL